MRPVAIFVSLLFFAAPTVFAATGISPNSTEHTSVSAPNNIGTSNGSNHTLLNPLGQGSTLSSFVSSILQLVVKIGAIVIIFMLVYVGFLFVVARGEPEHISHARQALLYTVIGALVLLGAQAIALGIQSTVQALSTGG